jgi:mono/diheme cytochrome c family protein
LAPRPALLIAPVLLLAAGCLKGQARVEGGCASCHAVHHVREGTCHECHRGDPAAGRKELAHERLLTGRAAEHRLVDGLGVREGRRLVETLACRRCHRIGGQGNRFATDLDGVVWRRDQAELSDSITAPVENMPAFGLDPRQAEALIAFLLRSGRPGAAQDTYRVRFERRPASAPTTFDKQCGDCHRRLGPSGPAGTGSQGPNLSGLFTPFYPHTAPGHRPWTTKALADWLHNPRAARAGTTMPPVALREGELQQVVTDLGGPIPAAAALAHTP